MSPSTATRSSAPVRAIGRGSYALGAVGGGIRGYELGVVSGALLFAGPALGLDPVLTGWVVSSALVGSIFGALGVGPLADRFGRRRMLALGAALYIVGILGAALTPNAGVLIASRIVLGLAVGIATAMIPVYLSEISPARRRGSSTGLFQVMITIGVLVASLVALAFAPTGGWRWMFGLGVIPAAAMLFGSLRIPESPRWLVRIGREDEARAILTASRGAGEAEEEIGAIRGIEQRERSETRGRSRLLRSPGLVRLLVVGSVLGILQQLIGINAITYYAPTVLKGLGFSDAEAIGANVGISALGLVTTIVMAFVIVDRLGRKGPLMVGALLMALSMVILAIVFLTGTSGGLGWLAVAALALFQVAFGLSWGGIVWIVLGEMFPLAVRGAAMGFATFVTELTSVIVGLVFPSFLAAGAPTVFFTFAAMGVVAFLFATFLVPETKGRTLEQIEADLSLTRRTADGG